MSPRTGRRAGDSGTREAILAAARAGFARCGYDGATMRAIAAEAGVDPALVHHFYGTKEQLFVAAMRFPVLPSEFLSDILTAERDRLGEVIVRLVMAMWDDPEARSTVLGLFRSAVTNDGAARMLREFVSSTILGVVRRAAGPSDAEFRASLVASQVVGLMFTRFVVGLEPIASAGVEDLVAAIGPSLQRYLTGEIGGGRGG